MQHILGKNRDQMEIMCLDQMIDCDSAARQIEQIVDSSDTSYFGNTVLNHKGRPPFNPKDMLKLYIYGFENGIFSSRKLERESKRNIEVMWLLKGLKPDDRTICNFRKNNVGAIARFFNEFCVKLFKEGFIDGKIIGIDGTKIRANNAKANNFNKYRIEDILKYTDQKLAELNSYMDELDRNDQIEKLEARKAKYESFKAKIQNGDVSEISTTDPDSRRMKQNNGGTDVSYNVQAAFDSKNKLIAGMTVVNNAIDITQLSNMSIYVKENLGLDEMTVVADSGYHDTDELKTCHDAGIKTLVLPKAEGGFKDSGLFHRKHDFRYNPEFDCFHCPAGRVLPFSTENKEGIRIYGTSRTCKKCPIRSHCTTKTEKYSYRRIQQHKYHANVTQNQHNLNENPKSYALRKALCEHPFGTIKRTMGFRQFFLRGLDKVRAETALLFLCYNLKRLRTIMQSNFKNTAG